MRPRIGINCVIVTMGFDKEDLSGYLHLHRTLYFRLSFWLFCTWIYVHVPKLPLQRCKGLIEHHLPMSINVHQQMV